MQRAPSRKLTETLYLFVSKDPSPDDIEAMRLLKQLPYTWKVVHVDPTKRATPALDAYPLGYQVLLGLRTLRDFVLDQQEELGLNQTRAS